MGLDMYLTAKKYVTNYDYNDEAKAEQHVNRKIKEALDIDEYDSSENSVTVSVTVAYWRKANQIHGWFVNNVQEGRDECQETYVSREQLQNLLTTVSDTLTTRDTGKLKPTQGFFFGSKDVDEWYWDDLEHTQHVLTKVLNDEKLKRFSFYYQSSW